MNTVLPDTARSGLYRKYIVSKSDGTPVEPGAQYLVLRIDSDPGARAAAVCYAEQIQDTMPELANDIRLWVLSFARDDEDQVWQAIITDEYRLQLKFERATGQRSEKEFVFMNDEQRKELARQAAIRRAVLRNAKISTYRISRDHTGEERSITCLCCGLTSYLSGDIEHKRCPFCEAYHTEWTRGDSV